MADRTRTRSVRLSDVARLAQCSAATVSRVLNTPDRVNPEARQRVEAAVRDLGYTRNGAARALRSKRSHIIGVILPTVRQPIYAELVGALQDRLTAEGYALIVTTSGYRPERELHQARILAERGIDALVLVGHSHPEALYALLDAKEMPSVSVYTYSRDVARPAVGFDDGAAMERVVDHLHGLGHREIALLSGPARDSDRAQGRMRGVEAAMARRGLTLEASRGTEQDVSFEGGRIGLRTLMAAAARPTAVVCTNDLLAIGALFECMAQGIAVPNALSVTGFDDLPGSAQVIPALTTVAIPSEAMGKSAADYLTARLAGRRVPDRVLLDTCLVLRGSTAPPAAAGGADAPIAPRADSEVS